MAKGESIQEYQDVSSTVEMFHPMLSRYVRSRRGKRWAIGVGAYLDLVNRVESLESAMKYGVSPTIRYLMKILEQYGERDSTPGAASLAYEWQSHLKEVTTTIENMLRVFDDLEKRLSCYSNLAQQVSELLKIARSLGNRNIRDAVLALHDALHGIYSEDLTSKQVEAIGNAVNHLYDLNLDRESVRALDRELRESGLETIPSDRFVGIYSERQGT